MKNPMWMVGAEIRLIANGVRHIPDSGVRRSLPSNLLGSNHQTPLIKRRQQEYFLLNKGSQADTNHANQQPRRDEKQDQRRVTRHRVPLSKLLCVSSWNENKLPFLGIEVAQGIPLLVRTERSSSSKSTRACAFGSVNHQDVQANG